MRPNKRETLCVPSTISSSISPLSPSLFLSLPRNSFHLDLDDELRLFFLFFPSFYPSNIRTRFCSHPYFSSYRIQLKIKFNIELISRFVDLIQIWLNYILKETREILFLRNGITTLPPKYSLRVKNSSYDSIRILLPLFFILGSNFIFHPLQWKWLEWLSLRWRLVTEREREREYFCRSSASEDMKFQPIPQRFSIPGPDKCILFSRSNRLCW